MIWIKIWINILNSSSQTDENEDKYNGDTNWNYKYRYVEEEDDDDEDDGNDDLHEAGRLGCLVLGADRSYYYYHTNWYNQTYIKRHAAPPNSPT